MSDEWRDPGRVAEYPSREIPHRDIAEAMLVQALPARVERFIDLGTGDGRLIALVRERHPDARALGIDFSEPMFGVASTRFESEPLVELRQHDLSQPLAVPAPVDAVVSALAIHHLEDARKRALFGEIRALLRPGGVFLNLDLVSAATREQHERFRLAIGRPPGRSGGPSRRPVRSAGLATRCRIQGRRLPVQVAAACSVRRYEKPMSLESSIRRVAPTE